MPGRRMVVTGACGFIGTVLSLRLLDLGHEVVGIDNLSRPGSEINLRQLEADERFRFHRVDLADWKATSRVFAGLGAVDAVFHLAGQVAVTTSYEDRRLDFAANAQGSLHLLEAVLAHSPAAWCLYASTNKVYGHLVVSSPIGIDQPIDPCTPYGVSKASAELYFSEYGRPPLGLATCSLRQSCIYGHHQMGTEDQGWLAWFAVANLLGLPVTLYGDGRQVRDLLFVDDLVELYLECLERRLDGVYPVGGGEERSSSLLEAMALIERLTGRSFAEVRRRERRAGDQPYFVADLGWLAAAGLDWRPRTGVEEGVASLLGWLTGRLPEIARLHGA